MWLKLILVVLLILVVYNLFSSFYYLMSSKGQNLEVVRRLTWRIGLSLLAFSIVMIAYMMGLLRPNVF